MTENMKCTIKLEDLISNIWARGDSKSEYDDGPRFCIDPDLGELYFKNKEITHYDFEWKVRGQRAILKLYQGKEDGEVVYGAVYTARIKFVGRVGFVWCPDAKGAWGFRQEAKKK